MPLKRQTEERETIATARRGGARLNREIEAVAPSRCRAARDVRAEEETSGRASLFSSFKESRKRQPDESENFARVAEREETQKDAQVINKRAVASHENLKTKTREAVSSAALAPKPAAESESANAAASPSGVAEEVSARNEAKTQTKEPAASSVADNSSVTEKRRAHSIWSGRNGHALTFVGIFIFTAILYYRPYELLPSLSGLTQMALVAGVITLLIYLPSQLALEGNLTAHPPEVIAVLLLTACGFVSVVMATDHQEAWNAFSDVFIKAVIMFVVLVNVLRTKLRLQTLVLLALSVSAYLSIRALLDYAAGITTVEGYRVMVVNSGMFANPNDLALHLVTMMPLAVGLFLVTRNWFIKPFYAGLAVLIVGATVVTYSRGGFLGLAAAAAALAWKLGRRNRVTVSVIFICAAALFFALAPGNYAGRLMTIFTPHAEESANARANLLTLSIKVALRHPVFGVGMNNFPLWSVGSQVTHNAYTQVAAEMGAFALLCYLAFMIAPFKGLLRIEAETFAHRREDDATHDDGFFYYWSICLQASLVGYMVSSFFVSVAYEWYIYYLVGYAICLRRLYETKRKPQPLKANEENASETVEAAPRATLKESFV